MSSGLYYNSPAMAMYFPYFELAASLFILLLAFEIWTRHYENSLARFFSFFALTAFLCAILTYSYRIAFTLDIARDINRISAVLWVFIFPVFTHFALLFSKKDRFLRSYYNYLWLYLPPSIIGLFFLFTNLMYQRYEIQNIGIVSQPAGLYWLFIIEAFVYFAWGVGVLFWYARVAPQKTEKDQALLIAIGATASFLVGLVTDFISPLILGYRISPPTLIFDLAAMNFFIFIAMRSYSLFAISPALAANDIIETMPDALIVTDLDGCVIFMNDEAKKLLHASSSTLCHIISSLFKNQTDYEKLYDEVVCKKQLIERFSAELVDPLGENLPALINARLLRVRGFGETIGVVFVIRDIRG
ncbi:MAG: PAS domain-containing protein [Candidatus Margulisbacteria bacterium]|nr:PAS domain-containing protein [Candidatus Margulisiibacteriota bacterium]MBU1616418.1 PAS domain-containing protein [Candidatus Margulisiibacteriota bacterium]